MIVMYLDQNMSCVAINIYSGIKGNKMYNVWQLCKGGKRKKQRK